MKFLEKASTFEGKRVSKIFGHRYLPSERVPHHKLLSLIFHVSRHERREIERRIAVQRQIVPINVSESQRGSRSLNKGVLDHAVCNLARHLVIRHLVFGKVCSGEPRTVDSRRVIILTGYAFEGEICKARNDLLGQVLVILHSVEMNHVEAGRGEEMQVMW